MTPEVAQLQAVIDQRDTAISGQIAAIEEALARSIHVRISTNIDGDRLLVFGKLEGAWRLFVLDGQTGAKTPLLSCARHERVDVIPVIAKLVDGIASELQERVKERDAAILQAAEILRSLP